MTNVNHVGLLFAAIFTATMMAGVGLIAGVLYAGIGFFIDLFGPGLDLGTALAFLALIGMPLIFAAGGFVAGAAGAVVYNLFASWLGGMQMPLDFGQ